MNPQLSSEFPDRVVTLCDGRPGLRGGLHMEVHEPSPTLDCGLRTVDSSSPCLDFISSDETLDRYDEIISATGWKLENYQRNPVFQNAHKYGDIIFTLGKSLITEVRSGKLFQRIEFATDVNPMAKIAYGLYKGKFLNAVSVGFIPVRWENGGAGDAFQRKYLEQELLEVSAVGIPANPSALQLGLKAGAVEKSDLQDTFELLRQLMAAGSPLPATERGEGQGEGLPIRGPSQPSTLNHQLLHCARTLRDLIRRI